MKIDVKEAKKYPDKPFPFSGEISLSEADVDGDRPAGGAAYAGEYRWQSGKVRFTGGAALKLVSFCDRCGRPMDYELSARLTDSFAERGGEEDDADYTYENDSIDVDAYVREKLLLALPVQRLCKADCKGLCPVCGADRNEAPCACVPEREESPFAVLKRKGQSQK